MGRVFTPTQIENRNVPAMGAHEAAGQYILHELFETVVPDSDTAANLQLFEPAGNGVDSAMVYGSTAYGTAGTRSDLDILIFYRPTRSTAALGAIRRVLETASDTYQVPVEQNILPVGAVYNDREHGLEPLFVQHLLEIHDTYDGRWCRNNPTSGLQRIADKAEDPYAVNALALGYVSGRRNYFAKALTESSGVVNYNALQRAFELPSAVGRKAVAATMDQDDEPLDLSSRPGMHQRAREALFTQTAWDDWSATAVKTHDHLYALDQQYSTVLARTLEVDLSVEQYTEWIEARYIDALELAHGLAQNWTDILRARMEGMQLRLVRAEVLENKLVLAGDSMAPPEITDDFAPGSY